MNADPHAHGSMEKPALKGGLSQYFVQHRQVGWLVLVAVLVWGWISFRSLPQQEDPTIPSRTALLVTSFPGASALKMEQLVTRKLEDKIDELESIEEITSQSRSGVSILTIKQRPATKAHVEQEWNKVRARMHDAVLPDGCGQPSLDTDFGNTTTLLFALTSPETSEAENIARANLIRSRLSALRRGTGAVGRAAVFAFFPSAVAQSYRTQLATKFGVALEHEKLGKDIKMQEGTSFVLADFRATATREQLQQLISRLAAELAGTDGELHPDFAGPLVLMGVEDPLALVRSHSMPRQSYRELERSAERLEDELKKIPSMGRVRKVGNADEEVELLFSAPVMDGFHFTVEEVMDSIASRNAILPGGTFRAEGQEFPVQISGEYRDEDEMLGTVVSITPSGSPIYLRDLFEVRRGYKNPISYKVDVLHRRGDKGKLEQSRSVLLAAEMKEGNVIGQFNESVRSTLGKVKESLPDGVEVVTVSDQPEAVAERIHHFLHCFIEAVVVVVVVALFLMDWRSALVVATAIPLTVAITFGGMTLLGIPLHQISIASLIIALGMLVDDPVVASDGINRELAGGQPRGIAAWLGPYKLRRPILFGTIINIVAFLPLASLPGDKGAFILGLPVVVTIALICSRVVSMTFIPLLAFYLLRGQKGLESGGEIRSFFLFRPVDKTLIALLPRYRKLLQFALSHPIFTIVVAYSLLAASFGLTSFFGKQFFPPAERNQFLIDVQLPESASVVQTRRVCGEIASLLGGHSEITSAAIFSGGTAPRFYYNVVQQQPASHLGQIIINTRLATDVPRLLMQLRDELDHKITGARCVVKQLEQGPPVEAPVQIRVTGADLDVLRGKADEIASLLRKADGYKVHDDLGRRTPTLQIEMDQARASTLAINNSQVGHLAELAFAGQKVTELREGDHLVPVRVRLREEERNEAQKIRTLYVRSARGKLVPMDNFASLAVKPEYAGISHYNKLRSVTVKAYSVYGELPSKVLERARPAIDRISLPPGYEIAYAGEDKELRQSQSEMGVVMAISVCLITLAMVIQFNSVVKSVVVMLTVPLGLIGAFVGLAVTGASLGFMALLAITSLAGIVVSHIIVLSDYIEEARSEGMELKEALMQAGLVRLRAVLVTVLATVGGLIPLGLTGGELWHPLTAVHIFGLLFATLLTLVILPVLYYLFCARLKWIK